jgi:NADPH2:quinone reductase
VLAARIHEPGGPVRVEDVPEPRSPLPGQALIALEAASVNPVDVVISRGGHYTSTPGFPYVAGQEAVGRLVHGAAEHDEGALVYTLRTATGTLAERFLGRLDETWALPRKTDPAIAVALGIAGLAAWLPLSERALLQPGERVLVLGATGSVGRIAVQAAHLLGASHVVAAGRDRDVLERLRSLGADAVVELRDGQDSEPALRAAFGDTGPHVVFDPLWGEPARAALAIAEPRARIVQLGQSAGAEVSLGSSSIRSKALTLLGYSNRLVLASVRRDAHHTMIAYAMDGRLQVDLERYPLARADEAWEAVRTGSHRKPVVLPE